MRLIDADALKKAIDDAYREYDGYDPQDLMRFAERVDTEIDNAPTVYPICEDKACKYRANKRPHGKWILHQDSKTWECDKCGKNQVMWSNYCPNCGAKMDGGEE